jgi:hypothetical protein
MRGIVNDGEAELASEYAIVRGHGACIPLGRHGLTTASVGENPRRSYV